MTSPHQAPSSLFLMDPSSPSWQEASSPQSNSPTSRPSVPFIVTPIFCDRDLVAREDVDPVRGTIISNPGQDIYDMKEGRERSELVFEDVRVVTGCLKTCSGVSTIAKFYGYYFFCLIMLFLTALPVIRFT